MKNPHPNADSQPDKTSNSINRSNQDHQSLESASNESFRKISQLVSQWAGSPMAFAAAIALVGIWAALGPVFKYSDTWQLVINTGTTIITFLMVFLIQNSQNRESKITQIKIDELLRATKSARNQLVDLEDMADVELDRLHAEFRKIPAHAEAQIQAIADRKRKA